MEKIWLSDSWYIPVDNRGYFEGKCPEGVLGSILTIRVRNRPKARLALKIPRLLADTIQENTYISEIAEEEARAVYDIFTGEDKEGLVQCRYIDDEKGVLAKKRMLHAGIGEGFEQNNHVVFVSFEKGKRPRVCSVSYSPTGLSVFPEGAKEDIQKVLNQEIWEKLEGKREGVYTAFQRSTFCALVQTSGHTINGGRSVSAGLLEAATDAGRPLQAWYAGIPSIVFDWAGGNLQEAVGRERLKGWSIQQHLQLFIEVLTGIDCLHRLKMLHGDIRPANIMAVGNPTIPASYKVGDFGGFRTDGARGDVDTEGSGQTRIGPTLGKGRVSPFYSPERRAGIERESADIALILHSKTSREYFIWVGWRSQLIDAETDDVSTTAIAEIEKLRDQLIHDGGTGADTPTDSLWSGDRLRLRDYVFEIIQARILGGNLCCLCKARFFRVIHDRMTVVDEGDPLIDGETISLAQYAEYRQWSAATDLYGAGALALYCLFTSSRQRNLDKSVKVKTDYTINAEFAEMMTVLESIPYFSVFWTQLEEVRAVLESLPADMSPEEAFLHATPDGKKLHAMVENAVNNMVQSAPNVRAILAAFIEERDADQVSAITPPEAGQTKVKVWNMAHFVLFMHFALSCLHRQNHLQPTNRVPGTKGSAHVPFCRNRTDKPVAEGPAFRALSRLRVLSDLFTRERFAKFCIDPQHVPDFDPRSDFLVRLDDKELTQRVRDIVGQAQKIDTPHWGKGKAEVLHLRSLISAAETTLREISGRAYNLQSVEPLTPAIPVEPNQA